MHSTLGLSVLPLCLSSTCPSEAKLFHPLSQVCLHRECRCLASGLSGTSSIAFPSPTLFSAYVFFLINVETGSNLLNINNIPQVLSPLLATNVSCLLSFILNFLKDLSMITVFVPIYSPIYCPWLFVHSTAHVGIYVNEHVCAYTHIHTPTHKFL